MVPAAFWRRALRVQRAGRLPARRAQRAAVHLVSSSLKHSGSLSRAGIELLGRIVSRQHERVGWDRPPPIGDRIAERVIAKAANTDSWNPDAPVFLAPTLARAIRIEQPPDYRETRLYVPPRRGQQRIDAPRGQQHRATSRSATGRSRTASSRVHARARACTKPRWRPATTCWRPTTGAECAPEDHTLRYRASVIEYAAKPTSPAATRPSSQGPYDALASFRKAPSRPIALSGS